MRLRGINNDDELTKGIELLYSYKLKYFNNNSNNSMNNEENIEKAKHKKKIVMFFRKYGIKTTLEAFEYKKTQIYEFNNKLKQNNDNYLCLLEKSKSPINKRKKDYIKDEKILNEIKRLRTIDYFNIGKEKLKIFLDRFCINNKLECVSVNKIANTLKIKPELTKRISKISHFGKIKERKKNKKLRIQKDKQISAPGEVVQIDSITTYINNIKRYTITAVDRYGRQVFAYGYNKLNSKNAQDFLQKFIYVYDYKVLAVQTDNGLEFHGYFQDYCIKNNIEHYYNYPKCPKMNKYVERFNRTIQEDFINSNEYLFINNIKEYNIGLMKYLFRYNTERPHKSLNNLSPINYLISQGYFSDMYPSHTSY